METKEDEYDDVEFVPRVEYTEAEEDAWKKFFESKPGAIPEI